MFQQEYVPVGYCSGIDTFRFDLNLNDTYHCSKKKLKMKILAFSYEFNQSSCTEHTQIQVSSFLFVCCP